MKRWNGWGEESHMYPLPDSAARYLAEQVGAGACLPDAAIEQVLAAVPPSRLASHPLISVDAEERLRHARGQSLPDWIALRSGRIGVFPDGVAYPACDEDVRALLDYARRTGTRLIPYGGGTSVVGHINPLPGDAPVLTLDLSRLNHLLELDETSHLATFEAGVAGPEIERQLRARGYTLGHFPQSFEFSTLGGWIATRSSGQQSYYYGRIESLFAGGHLETPLGALDLPPHPASAAGPDIKQLILGSEGRLGVVTRATLRVRRVPETETFHAAFFHDWEQGVAALREIAQNGIGVSMLRLSNAMETTTTLALAGKDDLVKWADRGLRTLRYGEARCLLIFGVTGSQQMTRQAYRLASGVIRCHGGLLTGTAIGEMWRKSRFLTPYLRNTLWERGYALDTLETAVPWANIMATAEETQKVIREGLADPSTGLRQAQPSSSGQGIGERVLVFAHLSHVYKEGAGIYVTYLYRRVADPNDTLRGWHALKSAASRVILAHGGTISHQHGVGLDHAPYLVAEKGEHGIRLLEAARRTLDPQGVLNPGKLLQGTAPKAYSVDW
ncbi:MAG: FAD-binding oxidoreductase [Anaerolineales bacterium]|nr:FAD-binding oxidoreductase [Anaerolineales bacterium]